MVLKVRYNPARCLIMLRRRACAKQAATVCCDTFRDGGYLLRRLSRTLYYLWKTPSQGAMVIYGSESDILERQCAQLGQRRFHVPFAVGHLEE
jgi:hypothetical protein